jgi:uncharacterized membrane protein YfcA
MFSSIFAIGVAGGLLSGLLGVGGGVVMLPLLTTVGRLPLGQAAGVTVVQVAAASLVSVLVFRRGHAVHTPLALHMGTASAVAAVVAGYASPAVPSGALEGLFLLLVFVALALLFGTPRGLVATAPGAWADGGLPAFSRWQAVALGGAVGILAGLLGAGGGFLIVPLLIGGMRLPTRLAVGTSPLVVLMSGSFALCGKLLAGEVRPDLAVALVISAAPCAYLGARLSARLSPNALRALLGAVLLLIAAERVATLLVGS